MYNTEWKFIEPESAGFDPNVQQPASYVRKTFTVGKPVRSALIRMTALGVYEPYLNGQRLGREVLLPGFTNYTRRVQYQEFDVTDLLKQGENVIGCVIGDGWYRGNVGAFNNRNAFGTRLKLAATLDVQYEDGSRKQLQTNPAWRATQNGPLRENDLKLNEVYDARMELTGWTDPDAGFDDSDAAGWHACAASSYEGDVIPRQGEELLEQEYFTPAILHTPDGSTVLDFGQNHAGHVRFTVTGPAGTQVSLIMGEALDEAGNFTLKNLQGDGDKPALPVGQRLDYILKEGTQTYQSSFLISGYQYVKLLNWPQEVRPENFTAIAIYSDLKQTGTFTCSNKRINQFVENVRWSQKSNFVDIPTDCPQRERAGWAGDISVFLETANYLTDTRRFIHKWMGDFTAAQKENGALPYIIPEVPAIGAGDSSAGWSDAVSTIPLMQYLFYGETEEIKNAYGTVKRLVEYNRRRARKRHLLHIYRMEPHYSYILDTGFHYGEWLEPGGSNIKDALKAFVMPDAEVATAWFWYTTKNLAQMAHLLGKQKDKKKYSLLAQKIRDAYRREFLPGGQVHSHRQCKYVRPLYMGLAENAEAPQIAERLNNLVKAGNYRIGTGFLTTYQVLQVLTDYGYVDTAYRLMENEKCPGWLYEVKQGANTVWEGWDALDPKDGKLKALSLNHYAPGAAVSWLFSRCAGIRPTAPGFASMELRPIPGGSLTYARAEYASVRGTIVSEWRIKEGSFILHAVIPDGIDTTVILPDGTKTEHAGSGIYSCKM